MKVILLTTLLFFSFTLVSQENRFELIKNDIESKINQNLWDEVLILAPDLIIEDVTRGDGYYYSALAFKKLGNDDLAGKYIQKAKNIADDKLLIKIKYLEDEMSSNSELAKLIQLATKYEKEGDYKSAAESWLNAWEKDKIKIEYAVISVSYLIDLEEYEEALKILNQPEVKQDYLAKELIKKINQTPEMMSLNAYNDAMKKGDEFFKKNQFELAKSEFEKALKVKPNDSKAFQKKKDMIEEIAWEKAKKSTYVSETENYADNYPYGKYISEAKSIIKSSYVSISQKAYDESNESLMIEYYNKYLKRFPGDAGSLKIKNLLLSYYINKGNSYMIAKEWYSAKSMFEAYLKLNGVGVDADHCRKSIKKCEWKLKQESNGFIAYSYDSISPIGVSFGYLNKGGLGFYSTIKLNKNIFTSLNGTIDDEGNTTLDLYNEAEFQTKLNETRNANFSGSVGLTCKLVYPIFVYAGAGIIYTSVYDRWEATDPNYVLQNVDRTYWLKNTDKTEINFFPEGGVIWKISNVMMLKYGVVYRSSLLHQFGVGFQF